MGLLQRGAQFRKARARRFDYQKKLTGLFNVTLPPVMTLNSGNHVDTSGETLLDEGARKISGLLFRCAGAEHNNFVGHSKILKPIGERNANIIYGRDSRMTKSAFSFARLGYFAAFLVVITYAFIALRGPKGIPGLLAKQQQIRTMEKRNALLAEENERMREHIERLANNPSEQELEIRERLKLVHPGEKVYLLNGK
jgi:cell division protein FtsB